MKSMKKALSLLLALVMCLSLLPMSAFAEEGGYATQADLGAAYTAALDALEASVETGDTQAAIAAMDAYLAVYGHLSPEDQAANAEAYQYVASYRENLVNETPDEGIESNALYSWSSPKSTITCVPSGFQPTSAKVSIDTDFGGWVVKSASASEIVLKSLTKGNNDRWTPPHPSVFWNGVDTGMSYNVRHSRNSYDTASGASVQTFNNGQTITYKKIETHTHSYSYSWYSNTQHKYSCSCGTGTTYANHSRDRQVSSTPADCTTAATTTWHCNTCNSNWTETTGSALGHDYSGSWLDNNAQGTHFAGCTSTNHKKVCGRCGVTLQTEVHTYGPPVINGNQKIETCNDCGHQKITTIEQTASYTVEWLKDVNDTRTPLKASETRSGNVGATVSASDDDKVIAGYNFDVSKSIASATLATSGTKLTLVFTCAHNHDADGNCTDPNCDHDTDCCPKLVDNGKGITVTKTPVSATVKVGETAKWTIRVTNLSNVTKTVRLTDSLSTATLSKDTVTLAPGAYEDVTASLEVTEANVGTLTNSVTADTGNTPKDPDHPETEKPTVDSDPITVKSGISVEKTLMPKADGSAYQAGDTLVWEITVTNSGKERVSGLQLTDKLSSGQTVTVTNEEGLNYNNFGLDAGQSTTFTAKLENAGEGQYVNTAVVSKDGTPLDEAKTSPVNVGEDKTTFIVTFCANGGRFNGTGGYGTDEHYYVIVPAGKALKDVQNFVIPSKDNVTLTNQSFVNWGEDLDNDTILNAPVTKNVEYFAQWEPIPGTRSLSVLHKMMNAEDAQILKTHGVVTTVISIRNSGTTTLTGINIVEQLDKNLVLVGTPIVADDDATRYDQLKTMTVSEQRIFISLADATLKPGESFQIFYNAKLKDSLFEDSAKAELDAITRVANTLYFIIDGDRVTGLHVGSPEVSFIEDESTVEAASLNLMQEEANTFTVQRRYSGLSVPTFALTPEEIMGTGGHETGGDLTSGGDDQGDGDQGGGNEGGDGDNQGGGTGGDGNQGGDNQGGGTGGDGNQGGGNQGGGDQGGGDQGGGDQGGGDQGGGGGDDTYIPDDPTPLNPTPNNPPEVEIDDPATPLASANGLNSVDHFAYVIGYDDGTVRPENKITRAEVATIFFRLMTDVYRAANWSTTNDFSDVAAGSWYNNAISTCAKAGLVNGYSDGTFKPDQSITRAEFATIAARFLDEEITGAGAEGFADIEGHWAETNILRAAEAGWVNGDNGRFRPDDYISRAEVMTIVNRMLNRVPDADHMLPEMKTWSDNPKTAWYYEAVQEATNEHAYEWIDENVENWTELLTVRDWAALEKEWATEYSAED